MLSAGGQVFGESDDDDTTAEELMRLTRDDAQPVFEYACHEGNEGMRGMLSAARVEERQAAPAPAR